MSWEEIGAQYGIDFSGIENVGPSFDELAKKYNMSEKQISRYQTNKMTGEQFFKTLSAEEQRNILGPAKWMAWNDGLFEFDQLSRKTYSAIWGEGRRVASLKDLLGEEEARRYLEEIRNRKE